LTNNIGWKADYILVLDQADRMADLTGWVTLDNRSGATYKDAKLKLVAGEVNRVRQEREYLLESDAFKVREKAQRSSFVEESFFEYHIYDLQRKTTIKDKQTKQVSLLEAAGIGVEKEMIVATPKHYFRSSFVGRKDLKIPVNVFIKFKNEKANRLGMPLPAGVMRLYKEDSKGALQFIGEDRITHTPKDEEVKLKIGEAFDVVVERIQTSYRRPSPRFFETEWEVTLRNHKKEAVTVVLLEQMFGDWKLMSPTHPFKKVDAFTARFDVPVKPDEEVKVKYKVVVRTLY